MLQDIIKQIKVKIIIIKHPDGGSGSGIVLDQQGIIVTNCHVVEGCRTVGILTNEGKAYLGRILSANKAIDYAFILCKDLKLNSFPVLSSRGDISEGEDVVAIGHPYGYDFSVSKGIVSAAKRDIQGVNFIQTDVPINPGNSGGPLLDMQGEIIGINTRFMMYAQSLSFAVPSTYLINAYKNLPPEELWQTGEYCFNCGKMNTQGTKYCVNCGGTISPEKATDTIYENTGICVKCFYQNPAESKYCLKCGAQLVIKMNTAGKGDTSKEIPPDLVIVCKGCGQENKGKKYCAKCGAELKPAQETSPEKKPENNANTIPADMIIICPGCGQENKGKSYCTKCGVKLAPLNK